MEERAHAKADTDHTVNQQHNHTHLHAHEHVHKNSPSDVTITSPQNSLGTVVYLAATPRSAPAAKLCPGPRRHDLGLGRFKL